MHLAYFFPDYFLLKTYHSNIIISNFPACFEIPIFFSNLNSNCSNLLELDPYTYQFQ